jgi:hypothetical protein
MLEPSLLRKHLLTQHNEKLFAPFISIAAMLGIHTVVLVAPMPINRLIQAKCMYMTYALYNIYIRVMHWFLTVVGFLYWVHLIMCGSMGVLSQELKSVRHLCTISLWILKVSQLNYIMIFLLMIEICFCCLQSMMSYMQHLYLKR